MDGVADDTSHGDTAMLDLGVAQETDARRLIRLEDRDTRSQVHRIPETDHRVQLLGKRLEVTHCLRLVGRRNWRCCSWCLGGRHGLDFLHANHHVMCLAERARAKRRGRQRRRCQRGDGQHYKKTLATIRCASSWWVRHPRAPLSNGQSRYVQFAQRTRPGAEDKRWVLCKLRVHVGSSPSL